MKKTIGNQPARRQTKIRLGMFVSIGIALFIAAIYFVGQRQQLFNNTFRVSGIFSTINGLQIGNNVRFSGINVGIVDGIEQVTDSTVCVNMLIVESTRKFIKINAKAIIGTDGLMGSRIVVILPGTTGEQMIADNGIIETAQPVSLDDILLSLKTTVDNAALISGDLSIIMENLRDGKGTVGKLLMDSVMGENVARAMLNIKQGAGGFKDNMDAAGNSFLLRGAIKKKEKEEEKAAKDKAKGRN